MTASFFPNEEHRYVAIAGNTCEMPRLPDLADSPESMEGDESGAISGNLRWHQKISENLSLSLSLSLSPGDRAAMAR